MGTSSSCRILLLSEQVEEWLEREVTAHRLAATPPYIVTIESVWGPHGKRKSLEEMILRGGRYPDRWRRKAGSIRQGFHERTGTELRDEILSDAKRKADRTLTRARKDAKKAHGQAAEEQRTEREAALGRAQERADARSQAILATVSQEVRRRRLLAREEVIAACVDEALSATKALSAR